MLSKQSLLVGSLTVILIFSYIITGNILAKKGNSALLSLEPSTITMPFLDSKQGCTLLILKLKIYNVTNLKVFSLKLDYNTSILEFIGGKMDRIFYTTVGGWKGAYTSVEFSKAFSGSGTMFIYYFKVLSVGSTQIKLKDTLLIDNSGANISHVISGATVKILPFKEWIKEKYLELKSKYNMLLINYTEILTKYKALNSTYKALLFNYNKLNNTYYKLLLYSHFLNQSYNLLKNRYNLLNSSFSFLKRNYYYLQKNYKNLQLNYRELESQFKTITNLFTITKNIIYCLAITTIILIIISIYFIKKLNR